ncbi:pentatricopeptide repeat-containing protein At3g24000, mitochondrial-like isoform X1 [Macadamia integrifolia]|uniref:pentatricopeptide repeat-containing protein At3g24000, mitochondrial-like isoform X1 n=1 Tax=Macadamia integrifolia TaxID=60698 RepID=UPI001C4E6436|nr:pentatricopeptide repeat-containing protein At3g24000, mitochondrial-like isoform X1 [Macadamia integrifolia]XP_042501705.1 pentatricopeptide repeat-containing protein At3g24000, mitochondrial-like isoform X1 [Macadamia integrifolia]XP_042501707.1 pentatricopeptide repeat-containing protein At3g24000, mitochondrial-like isoform X1 [Macadamia integrifolia]XP_042501708.1 pentatricopeptide repeat-containing protein At3g24000, mitochondrial-like isoform X1 [Macadamia integrifolia]XP_042501709.1 
MLPHRCCGHVPCQVKRALSVCLPVHFIKGSPSKRRPFLGSLQFNSSSCALKIIEEHSTVGNASEDMAVSGLLVPLSPSSSSLLQFARSPQRRGRALVDSSKRNLSITGALGIVEMESVRGSGRTLARSPMKVTHSDCEQMLRKYSGLLQVCASKGFLIDGMAVHGHVVKIGVVPDSHLWNCLVNMYAKCGRPQNARQILEEMPDRDVVSWTALIAGYVAHGDGSEGVCLFLEMRRDGVWPNAFAFATGLKACSMCFALDFGKQVHGEVIKVGNFSDIFVGSALIDLYAKCGEMELARKVFLLMPECNSVSWNALLCGYAQIGEGEEVLKLFQKMTESEPRLSNFTLSTVLKVCATSVNARIGKAVHSLAVKIGSDNDWFLTSGLVDMYSKCGLAEDAYKVFVRIKDPDVVAWSSMISCFNHQGQNYEAAELFGDMARSGVMPNQFTLASLISIATDLGDLQFGKSIHASIWKFGYGLDNLISNALVTMYMKNGSVEDGYKVFESMTDWDLVSWNALLSGFHDGNACDQGPTLFKQMFIEGFKPNMYTFISILRSCTSLSSVGFGQQVHGHIIKNSLNGDGFVGTALVDMYAKSGCLEDAQLVFKRMKQRDLFTWTVIITGCAQTDQGEKAIEIFCQMQREGVCPNEFTFASCLRGCSSIAALVNGQLLHSLIIKAGHSDDMFVMSALVDMYGKCGCIEDAEALFSDSASRDTVSWNTIICGYAQHGHVGKALKAFQSMLNEGIRPDEVTFLGVLSACSHGGLIEEGQQYFHLLKKVYEITPTVEHYACMVDILGRAGKLDEVESFIEKMNLTTSALIWQTVLGACKMHGNVGLGEKAAKKLFEIEPKTDSSYILLSNIYASKRRWDDVAMIRTLMSTQGVKKEPGCSWVEVSGQVHVFLSKDVSHPKVKEIYMKLVELHLKLSLAGYIPNTKNVLHDVDEREQKESLIYHSERLAFAFALLSMRPGRPIRIFKNLRICGDCHDVFKLISNITNATIVIRDVSRFHHFQSGSCSCRDYW